MRKHEIKEQQRTYIERLLSSDLSVPEWCRRNSVPKQSMYEWLSAFAESEPELFGGVANIVDRSKRRWVESTRANIAASNALATRQPPGVILIDTLFAEPAPTNTSTKSTEKANDINVRLNGASIAIPAGSATRDISSVLKVISKL